MTKGENTKTTILETGLELSSRLGLQGVTIGTLAKAANMSKSGLFAHFQSKENLQIEILKFAGQLFSETVIIPALKAKAGITRIRTLVERWGQWESTLTGGCIFVAASTDFKDRPGKVRDYLVNQQIEWVSTLRRLAESAVQVGDFRKDADCEQFSFELNSLLLGFHLYDTLLNYTDVRARQQTALERLLSNFQ